MQSDALSQTEDEFLSGDLAALCERRCPECGGELLFSVACLPPEPGTPTSRRKAGICIYCIGHCNRMLSHLDGYCPAWAEAVKDWPLTSTDLRNLV